MDKLTMAHEWAMKHSECASHMDFDVKSAWEYADAMQAEADKRNPPLTRGYMDDEAMKKYVDFTAPKAIVEAERTNVLKEDWQPDWSVAPVDADAWKIVGRSEAYWLKKHTNPEQPLIWLANAPTFNYQGDWKDSLRERPQQEPKQHACNCAHWKNSSFFMGDTFTCKDCGGSVTI